jgi:hypothetical protein
VVWTRLPCPSRYASSRTFDESALVGDSVHMMRSFFSD